MIFLTLEQGGLNKNRKMSFLFEDKQFFLFLYLRTRKILSLGEFDELKSHLFLVHFSILILVRIEYLIYRIMQKLTKLSLAGKEKGRRKMQQ